MSGNSSYTFDLSLLHYDRTVYTYLPWHLIMLRHHIFMSTMRYGQLLQNFRWGQWCKMLPTQPIEWCHGNRTYCLLLSDGCNATHCLAIDWVIKIMWERGVSGGGIYIRASEGWYLIWDKIQGLLRNAFGWSRTNFIILVKKSMIYTLASLTHLRQITSWHGYISDTNARKDIKRGCIVRSTAAQISSSSYWKLYSSAEA